MTRPFNARNAAPAALLLALFLAACGGSDQESASSTAEEAADQARDAVNEATQAAGDMTDEAVQATQEAAEDLSQATEDAAEDAVATAEETANEVEAATEEAMDEANEAVEEATATAGAAAAAAAAAIDDDDPCTLGIEVGDNIAYSTESLSAPASCSEVTVTISHTGRLPAAAMGHNWVLVPEDALQSVAQAGVSAGADADYVPDDDRVVAATGIVGGGESDSVSFSLDALQDGVTYRYVCTFPGHWMVMQGTFTVSG